jgi:hypothetical protein
MNISTFDELLQAAQQQPHAQRLLLVFAGASAPDNASAADRARFESGAAGELTPLMCVDKTPEAIGSFAALCAEANQFGQEWALVFVAGMSGQGDVAPTEEQAQAPLEGMVQAIKDGRMDHLVPFNRSGHAVRLRRMGD